MLFVRLFDLCLFWICRFPLPLVVLEGLRFVIVALPGLFSYLFLASCKSALTSPPPPPPHHTHTHTHRWFTLLNDLRRWSGVSLTLCCFLVYSTRRFVLCLTLCHFVLVFFSYYSIAITSLGEERANLSVFRTFVRFELVWICRFPLPLGVWEGLRFRTLPGLFSYPFFEYTIWCFMTSFDHHIVENTDSSAYI